MSASIQRELSFDSLKLDKPGLAGSTGNAGNSFFTQTVQRLASLPLPLAERCLTESFVWKVGQGSQGSVRAFLPNIGWGCGKNKRIVDGIRDRLIDKAGYTQNFLGMSRKTRFQRFFDMLRGSGAVGRYQRSLDRALHKCDIELFKLMALSEVSLPDDVISGVTDTIQAINPHRQKFDLKVDDALKNPVLFKTFLGADAVILNQNLHPDDVANCSRRNKIALWSSKAAFVVNGLSEFLAAPTGWLRSTGRKLLYPSQDVRKWKPTILSGFCLGAIVFVVSTFSLGVFSKGIGAGIRACSDYLVVPLIRLIASFSALGVGTALTSLGFVAVSTTCREEQELPESCQAYLRANLGEALARIGALLIEVHHDKKMEFFLCEALQNKAYFAKDDLEAAAEGVDTQKNKTILYNTPTLVTKLMSVLNSHYCPSKGSSLENPAAFHSDIAAVLGHYLLCENENPQSLSTPKSSKVPNRAQLHEHDQHVQALLSMVEHFSIAKFEGSAEDLRQATETYTANARDKCLTFLAEKCPNSKLKSWISSCANHKRTVSDEDSARSARPTSRYAFRNIQDNPEQYDFVTRCFAKMAYIMDEFNDSVVLSLNGLIARFGSWSLRHGLSRGLKCDAPILPTFYAGRFVSSSIWAFIDALILLPLAAGQPLGFNSGVVSPTGSGPFPIRMQHGGFLLAIAVISTALQMLAVMCLVMPLRLAAIASAVVADKFFMYEQNPNIDDAQRKRIVFASDALLHTTPNPYYVSISKS